MHQVQNDTTINNFLYRTLIVLLGLIATVLLGLCFDKFARAYKIEIKPKVAKVQMQPVRFARTPIVGIAGSRLALMAISYHADVHRRSVILRDLKSNELMILREGERTHQGLTVASINRNNVRLKAASNVIIISMPSKAH